MDITTPAILIASIAGIIFFLCCVAGVWFLAYRETIEDDPHSVPHGDQPAVPRSFRDTDITKLTTTEERN